jgi:hypothetical protein
MRHANTDGDSNSNAYADSYANCDSNRYAYTVGYANRNAVSDANVPARRTDNNTLRLE